MDQRKIFQYDVFLSHRTGDGAADIRTALERLGCSVWFDDDKPLTDRRLFKAIREGFKNSRTVLAFLSANYRPSPWTVLEMAEALASESAESERLLFFVPDQTSSNSPDLPADVSAALTTRRPYSMTSIDCARVEAA